MITYTHAVIHRILTEEGKQSDEVAYAIDLNHAYALAHQLMAVGRVGVTIIQLKEPTTISDSEE